MTPDDLLLAVLILAAAALYSAIGHGGASAYLAAMGLVGLAPETMRPSVLALNILVATLGVIRYTRAGFHDWKLLLPFALASAPMAFVGGTVAIPGTFYRPLIGVVLFVAAAQMLRTAQRAAMHDARTSRPPLVAALGAGAAIGLFSGLTGTGGGVFLSPLLLFMGWATTRQTSGIAAAFILANSVAGLAGTSLGAIAFPSAFPLWAAAALGGGLIGTHLGTGKLPTAGLRVVLALVLAIAGVKLIAF